MDWSALTLTTDGGCLELAGKTPTKARSEISEEILLVRQAQNGDRAAFETLVHRYDRQVLRLALQLVRSAEEARDLYQEAFLKVYRSLPRFQFQSQFSTWLYRVVTNVCLDHLRRRKITEIMASTRESDVGQEWDDLADDRPALNPERAFQAKEIRSRISHALAKLNPRERLVFELRHYQGLRLRTIGNMVGTSEETVKNCLFRETQKLRFQLGDLL